MMRACAKLMRLRVHRVCVSAGLARARSARSCVL